MKILKGYTAIENKKGRGSFIIFIILSALIIRIIYIFQITQFPLTEYLVRSNVFDQHTFDNSAINIFSGEWIGKEVFGKEPLYPYFLAIIYKVFGYSHVSVYIIQATLTTIGVALLYKITKSIFNNMAGCIAGCIFALYSLSIYYDAILLRESLITFLNILLLYLVLRAEKANKTRYWLVGGIVLGLLMLMRHNMLLPFILIYILYRQGPFKKAVKYALVFFLGMFIALLPVITRNYIISNHQYIGISREVNAFWVGNNPESIGVDVVWSSEYNRLNDKSGGSIKKTFFVFLEEIKKRPVVYAKLYLRKVWMFFNAYEAPSNTSYYLDREEFPTILRWPFFNFQFVCSLALIGILLVGTGQCPVPTMKSKSYILYIFLFGLSLSVILFHIQDRFRLPVVPFFIIFASYSLYYIIDRLRNKEYMKPIAVITASIILFVILTPDLTYGGFRPRENSIRSIDRTNLALAYIDEYGKYRNPESLEKALMQCNLALESDRASHLPYAIKGRLYYLQGAHMDSIMEFKKALVYDNHNPFLYNDISGVYYGIRDYNTASIFVERALILFPGNKVFEKNRTIILRTVGDGQWPVSPSARRGGPAPYKCKK